MKEGDLVVVAACPVIYVLNQCLAYRQPDYQVIKELRS